ncbi:MAG: hypothetical protein AB1625_07285 [Acidobacteriota bacterium]
MAKLDLNLDAYRLIAECLHRIRQVLREELRALHGDDWAEAGLPEELRENLSLRRSHEASINWHLSDSADLLDYAGFSNIYDVVAASPDILRRFASLAPDPNVLRIRFLELDTILNRIAFIRPVTDTEMGFLVSFDERLRKVAAGPSPAERPAKPAPEPTRPAPLPERPRPAEPPAAEERPAKDTKPAPKAASKIAPAAAPPKPSPAPEKTSEAPVADGAFEDALAGGKDPVILSSLYREITSLADGLWSHGAPAAPHVWEKVRESEWYNQHFAQLGLKPVSDFYALVEEARDRMLTGISRSELQELLKERNFAQVLLSLRELFKQHLTN